jgi:hypothetical protein
MVIQTEKRPMGSLVHGWSHANDVEMECTGKVGTAVQN